METIAIAWCNNNIVEYIEALKKVKNLNEIEIAEKIATIGHSGIWRERGAR